MKYSNIQKDINSALYFKESLSNLYNIYTNSNGISFFNINRTFVCDIPVEVEQNYVTYYTAKENEFWTLISYKNYGTIRYWWLICKVNGVIDPTKGPKAGQKIKILSQEYVDEIVNAIQKG